MKENEEILKETLREILKRINKAIEKIDTIFEKKEEEMAGVEGIGSITKRVIIFLEIRNILLGIRRIILKKRRSINNQKGGFNG